jgi:hypothetical protein
MKKLKISKNKPKNKENTISTNESARSIQKLIFQDIKNINKFNIIVEEFILSLQNNDIKMIKEYYQIIKDIFEYFLVKNKNIVSGDLAHFLETKIKTLISVSIDSFDSDDNKLNIILFKNIFELLRYINENELSEYFTTLADLFIFDDELTYEPSNIKTLANKLVKKETYLNKFIEILISKHNLTKNEIYNLYNFLISLDIQGNSVEVKRTYQNLIISILNSKETSKEIIVDLMLNLNKMILNNLENPLILADYIMYVYENSSGEEFDLKVLSLSGLFVLISKYKLDYPNYFTILYRTISLTYNNNNQLLTVFDSQYRARFIKILDLSLRTSSISIVVILSFIKVSFIINLLENGKNMPHNILK